MRVVFFGTPSFAAPTLAALLASPHEVVGVVTQPDRARGRGQQVTFAPVKALAVAHGLPVLQPERLKTADFHDALASLHADIGVVAAYGRILPQQIIDTPRLGMINVHASLLPRWRGAAPIHRAVQAGDAKTGVTIMRVVLALDAGPMLATVEVTIGPNERSDELEARLALAGAGLLVETLERLESGPVEEVPQDEAGVTYAARLERRDGLVEWSRPSADIHNQIRAMHPWPLVSVLWRGKRLILRSSNRDRDSITKPVIESRSQLRPAQLAVTSDGRLFVGTGDEPLEISELQLEGKRPQSAREFINGARPASGDSFA